MAKQRSAEKASESKADKSESSFLNLMMVAAEFVRSRGGIESAKKSLADTGRFIEQAGSVAQAERALEVLENLKAKISD